MKHTLQGNRVLIKLERFQEETSSGNKNLINPLYVDGATDGGKPVSMLNDFPLAPMGTVMQIAKGAEKTMEENKMEYKEGDRVTIQPHSLHKSNYFYVNPNKKVIDITDEGERHVAIHPINITWPAESAKKRPE